MDRVGWVFIDSIDMQLLLTIKLAGTRYILQCG